MRVEAALVALLKGNGEVAEVYTRAQIAETPMPTGSPQDWTLLQRARASFDPARSGDVLSLLRRGLAGFEQPDPVETVDIGPTLAALLGLAVPAGDFDGRCLDLDGGAGDTCQPAR